MAAKRIVRKRATSGRPAAKKPAAGKSAAARISPQEIRAMIQRKAYEIYVQRGRRHGRDRADWFEAERIVKSSGR